MKTEQDYRILVKEINDAVDAVAKIKLGRTIYITDECVDSEQCENEVMLSAEYWDCMYQSACQGAGQRCEDKDLDINEILGRVIY